MSNCLGSESLSQIMVMAKLTLWSVAVLKRVNKKLMTFLPWLRASTTKIYFNSCYMHVPFLDINILRIYDNESDSSTEMTKCSSNSTDKKCQDVCQGCGKPYQTATNLPSASTSAHCRDLFNVSVVMRKWDCREFNQAIWVEFPVWCCDSNALKVGKARLQNFIRRLVRQH